MGIHDPFAMPKFAAVFFGAAGVLAIVYPRGFQALSDLLAKFSIEGKSNVDDKPFFRSALWSRICGIILLVLAAVAFSKIHWT